MYKSFLEILMEWNRSKSERSKLQYAYVFAVVALVVLAGVVGLLNDSLSGQLLRVAYVIAIVYVINAVGWALLKSFVLERLPKPVRKTK